MRYLFAAGYVFSMIAICTVLVTVRHTSGVVLENIDNIGTVCLAGLGLTGAITGYHMWRNVPGGPTPDRSSMSQEY